MWIEVHTNIGRNRKVMRFANNLNLSIPAAVGHLVLLWTTIMEQAESGDITDWRPQELANAAAYPGDADIFFQALQDGFIDKRGETLLIHAWWEYSGLFLHRKYNKRSPEKLAVIQQLYSSYTDVAVNPPTHLNPPTLTHPPPSSASADADGAGFSSFDRFWAIYPKKVGKQAAFRAFKAAIKKASIEAMLAAIEKQKQSEQWRKDNGQFIPHPTTWLNQGRWDDEITAALKKREDKYANGFNTRGAR